MKGGNGGGTGFFVFIKSNSGRIHYYAVTNRHVIEKGLAAVIRVNRIGGGLATIPLSVYDWHYHPNGADIAVASIDINDKSLEFAAMPDSFLLTRQLMLETFETYLGKEAYMLGRFVHHPGEALNIPTARSGIISAMPNPEEKIPVNGMEPQEAFLIEMRSMSGFSGSPTFLNYGEWVKNHQWSIYKNVAYNMDISDDPKYHKSRAQTYLVGVDAGNFPIFEMVIEKTAVGDVETAYRAINHSGFSVVIPAWKIAETLDRKEFVAERKQKDNEPLLEEASVRLADDDGEQPA